LFFGGKAKEASLFTGIEASLFTGIEASLFTGIEASLFTGIEASLFTFIIIILLYFSSEQEIGYRGCSLYRYRGCLNSLHSILIKKMITQNIFSTKTEKVSNITALTFSFLLYNKPIYIMMAELGSIITKHLLLGNFFGKLKCFAIRDL
jgi:hypothetical protein